jgi:hypothetical protein
MRRRGEPASPARAGGERGPAVGERTGTSRAGAVGKGTNPPRGWPPPPGEPPDGGVLAGAVGAGPGRQWPPRLGEGVEDHGVLGAMRSKPGWFEMAQRGTLFLDEVGERAAKTQVDLLRVVEQREVRRIGGEELIPLDVRLVAATLSDVDELVAEGKLRRDLYYRINVVPLRLPPCASGATMCPRWWRISRSVPARGSVASPSGSPRRRCASSAITRGRGTCDSSSTSSIGWWPSCRAR